MNETYESQLEQSVAHARRGLLRKMPFWLRLSFSRKSSNWKKRPMDAQSRHRAKNSGLIRYSFAHCRTMKKNMRLRIAHGTAHCFITGDEDSVTRLFGTWLAILK